MLFYAPVARGGALRRIDKTRLRDVVGDNIMAAARRLAGDGATPEEIESRRNEILRYIRDPEAPSASLYMSEKKAHEISSAFKVTPDDFLGQAPTPREREIARLQKRLRALQEQQDGEHGQDSQDR